MKGFYIKELSVQGINMSPAEISFQAGANLVTGASDSGKSYLFAVLNFCLGRSQTLKDIPESVGYSDFLLEIHSFENDTPYTLFRKLGQSTIDVKQCLLKVYFTSAAEKKTYLTSGRLGSSDNISAFLLELCGLAGKQLLKNRSKGIKQNLGIKDIIKLSFIAEDKIITEESPFYYSRQYMNQIQDQSLLNLLLTGEDFSGITPKEDQDKRETRLKGKLEFISYQLSEYSQDRDKLVKNFEEKKATLDYDEVYTRLTAELQQNMAEAKELSNLKALLANKRLGILEKMNYNTELLARFNILEKQYHSDSQRLEFVLEAEVLSTQLGDVVCPLCSSPLDSNHIIHINEIENFREAANEELNKIRSKLLGLKETITNLSAENQVTAGELNEVNGHITDLEVRLETNFTPRIDQLKSDLREFMDFESITNEIQFVDKEVTKLYSEKDRLYTLLQTKEEVEEINLLPYTILADLSDAIAARLKAWNYMHPVNVVFDSNYKIFDIVISGKSRKSYGKGKRAISYTACLLGLLDYCLQHNRNFSNLIVLDSPLTTYEEKKNLPKEEAVSETLLNSFFRDINNTSSDAQLIIFDNKEPSDEIKQELDRLHIVIFTSNEEVGRRGFF